MEAETVRARGRPRSSELDQRILDVALRNMRQLGYDGMSMEQVAAEAGVGKATLYRRYCNKADLATAAVVQLAARHYAAAPPDDTREALVDHMRRFERAVSRGGYAVLGALLDEARDQELLELHRERVISRGKRRLEAILERARERGELRPGADVDAAIEMLIGSYFARRLRGGPMTGWAERVVDTVLDGLAAS